MSDQAAAFSGRTEAVRIARDLAIAAACPRVLRKRGAIWCSVARSLRVQALWVATGGVINPFNRGPYFGLPPSPPAPPA